MRTRPTELPQWHALNREIKLIDQLVGQGVTSLGRADFALGKGEYYAAFFNLSIGIERLCKFIYVCQFSIENAGNFPKRGDLKTFGHDIEKLVNKVFAIEEALETNTVVARPSGPITLAIIRFLDEFGAAKKGRYANFEILGDPSFLSDYEPIRSWWQNVVGLILAQHYRGTAREGSDREYSSVLDNMIGDNARVLHFSETGDLIDTIGDMASRTGENRVAQRYGRFYTLQIIRWLALLVDAISYKYGYMKGCEHLFGHYEIMSRFKYDQGTFLKNKVWTPR